MGRHGGAASHARCLRRIAKVVFDGETAVIAQSVGRFSRSCIQASEGSDSARAIISSQFDFLMFFIRWAFADLQVHHGRPSLTSCLVIYLHVLLLC
jgi:hypothetical protein